ncbi:MAG: hypothetical protein JW982_09180 [Spirochaetes bacterium]|nr:hypothetical protein [Spirochaetota bacterium]
MKKLSLIAVIILGLAVVSCSSASKKPSPLEGQWQQKNKTIAYKKFSKAGKWTPGQYVVTGNYNKGKKDSISKTTVVRKEKNGWVIETISTSKDGKITGSQMLISGYENAVKTGDGSKISLVWIKTMGEDGKVNMMEGESLAVYNVMMKSTYEGLVIKANSYVKAEAVSVPAGNFQGSTKITSSVKILFKTYKATTYLHPDVPVNGVIKTVSEDGEVLSELLDYGFDGKAVIQ